MTNFKQQMREHLARATKMARDEGYQAGYAQAIRDLGDISFGGEPAEAPSSVAAGKRAAADHKPMSPRGNNARLVSDALKSIAPRAAGRQEIISIIEKETGTKLAFSSTGHAINQLASRGEIERDGALKVWRCRSSIPSGGAFPHEIAVNDINIIERDNDLPDWEDLRGRAPNATGKKSSEAFVGELRDAWDQSN